MVKNLPADAEDTGDLGSIPGPERPPGGGNGNPLQYSCLENPMGGGAWRAAVHGVTESGVTGSTAEAVDAGRVVLRRRFAEQHRGEARGQGWEQEGEGR